MKASGFHWKRKVRPSDAPGSDSPRTMRMSIRTKRSGIRTFETRSIPFSTPHITTAAVAVRKAAWQMMGRVPDEANVPKASFKVDGSVTAPFPMKACAM